MTNDFGSVNKTREMGPRHMPGITQVMKYVVMVIIIVYIVLLMIYTSGSTKSYETIHKSLTKVLDIKEMKEVDGQGLKRYYGLNSADYDGVMLYTSQSSMSAEEILLIKVKDEGQMNRVKEAVGERMANRKNDFDGYAPEQVQLLEQSQLSVRGKFLFLAVAPKAEAYKETFMKSL